MLNLKYAPIAFLLLSACGSGSQNADNYSPEPPSSLASAAIDAPVGDKIESQNDIDWLNKKSIISVAPKADDSFADSIFKFGVNISKIDVCNLIDKISFHGKDEFIIDRGNVPSSIKKFAIVSGHGQYIMFPDGSLMGNGSTERETLGDYLKGFPDNWDFWHQRFYSLDFSKLPDEVRNGFMKVQSFYIDQKRDGSDGSYTIYEQRGDHTLIVVEIDGELETYMPRRNPNNDSFLPEMNVPSYYDTKYKSEERSEGNFWIGSCTTTHYQDGD